MNLFVLNLLLALTWAAVSGEFSLLTVTTGFGLGYLILVLLGPLWPEWRYPEQVRAAFRFLIFFTYTLIKASLKVAWDVVTPTRHFRPGVVALPLDLQGDVEITLLASLITLTPGSLVIDVAADRSCIYTHQMYIHDLDQVRRETGREIERRLLEVLR